MQQQKGEGRFVGSIVLNVSDIIVFFSILKRQAFFGMFFLF